MSNLDNLSDDINFKVYKSTNKDIYDKKLQETQKTMSENIVKVLSNREKRLEKHLDALYNLQSLDFNAKVYTPEPFENQVCNCNCVIL
jgi:hypothetical protein